MNGNDNPKANVTIGRAVPARPAQVEILVDDRFKLKVCGGCGSYLSSLKGITLTRRLK